MGTQIWVGGFPAIEGMDGVREEFRGQEQYTPGP